MSPETTSNGTDRQTSVLQIDDLHVAYLTAGRWTDVVRGVSLDVGRGETVGIVGESGCGKSTVAFAVMNYLGRNGRISRGRVDFQGRDLATMSGRELRAIRGNQVAMVYQNPMASLNPSIKIGRQLAEVVRLHDGLSKTEARARALAMLESVHMPAADAVMDRYPHQLSGGMQQRVVIAMSLITNPDLLIMDEPTTGLDVTTEATVLDLVNELKETYDTAILYISHNLGVIAEVCDRVNVMYAGQVVETGPVDELFASPQHPYSSDLLECLPRLDWHYRDRVLSTIEGTVPLPTELPPGCVYAPRCSLASDRCNTERPELVPVTIGDPADDGEPTDDRDGEGRTARCFHSDQLADREQRAAALEAVVTDQEGHTLLDLGDVRMHYPSGRGSVKAVDGVDFHIREGETFSLVGESGCGKSTLGRCVVGLLTPTDGSIDYDGVDVAEADARSGEIRQAIQMVFQNPQATLNPSHRVGRILSRTLEFFGESDASARDRRVATLLDRVRLDPSYVHRYPRQLSGGEKQRVAIARAFAGDPNLIVADEAVSALDVSVQASVLNLLVELKEQQHCAYLFISHDLAVVRYISDRIGVMYLGKLVEIGTSEQLFSGPNHPYTEALLSAVSSAAATDEGTAGGGRPLRIRLEGSVPSPIDPPSGCRFHTRCPRKLGPVCETEDPPWRMVSGGGGDGSDGGQDGDGDGHRIACHIELDSLAREQAVDITSA